MTGPFPIGHVVEAGRCIMCGVHDSVEGGPCSSDKNDWPWSEHIEIIRLQRMVQVLLDRDMEDTP